MGDPDSAALARLTAHLRTTAAAAAPSAPSAASSSSNSSSTSSSVSRRDSSLSSRNQIRTSSNHSTNHASIMPPVVEWKVKHPTPGMPPIVPPKDGTYYPRQVSRAPSNEQDPSVSSSSTTSNTAAPPSRHIMKRKLVIARSGSTDPRARAPKQQLLRELSPPPTPGADTDDVVLMTASSLANYPPTSSVQTKSAADHRMTGPPSGPRSSGSASTSKMAMVQDHTSVLACELEVLKREIEKLKERENESKRAIKKQTKKIDDLKTELQTVSSSLQAKDAELATVKTKSGQQEELITTIENTIQCQICMELPLRPYAISPCGHILCLPCLQEWFKKAPPTLDDMDLIDPDELTDPEYILRRAKSCPTCRARVRRKPAPVFMIKNVAAAVVKFRAGPVGNNNTTSSAGAGSSATATANTLPLALLGLAITNPTIPSTDTPEDPWDGIFEASSSEGEGGAHHRADDADDGTEYGSSDSDFGAFYDGGMHGGGPAYGARWGSEGSRSASISGSASGSDVGIGEVAGWHEGDEGAESDDGPDGRGVVQVMGATVNGYLQRNGQVVFHGNSDDDDDDDDDDDEVEYHDYNSLNDTSTAFQHLFPFENPGATSPPQGGHLQLAMSMHQRARVQPRARFYTASQTQTQSHLHASSSSLHSLTHPTLGYISPQYIPPRWEPPTVEVSRTRDVVALLNDAASDATTVLKLLRRGCTVGMLQSFEVTYAHAEGIVVHLRSLEHLYASDESSDEGMGGGTHNNNNSNLNSGTTSTSNSNSNSNSTPAAPTSTTTPTTTGTTAPTDPMHRVFIGWNIYLADNDEDGEVFMLRMLGEMKRCPYRWRVGARAGVPGARDARRLVQREQVWEYESEDSEGWVGGGRF